MSKLINDLQKKRINLIVSWIGVGLSCMVVQSQDLEPRILSPMPINGNFAIVSYGHSAGNILLDNTLPIEDFNAKLNNIVIGYVRSFKMFSKLTKFDVIVPYSFGKFNALVENESVSTTRSGFGDPVFRISMVLTGVKPMKSPEYFKQEQKKFIMGIRFRIKPPLGQYNPENFINLGANRWAFETGVAGSYAISKRIIFETHLNSWYFTNNNDFFGGNINKQKPIFGVQFHATYIIKSGIWFALSTGKTMGGKTEVNGIEKEETQNNIRFGLALAFRINKNNALKVAYTNGFITRLGADFSTILLGYQIIWFDKIKDPKFD